ncbi:DUF2283 domain-containing protein [Candidatus Lokiarchaeum ossiferum]|uniref:DUF2283 domain-containing protein n=1 Tax=Candidatus Lokiarchaeum ossiferum TaxID=2951803 RepID=UPI00352DFC2F
MMEFQYDKSVDILYIRFSKEKCDESDEICVGIIIDYNTEGNVIGIEILNFSQRKLDMNNLIKLSAEEIVPMVAQCL